MNMMSIFTVGYGAPENLKPLIEGPCDSKAYMSTWLQTRERGRVLYIFLPAPITAAEMDAVLVAFSLMFPEIATCNVYLPDGDAVWGMRTKLGRIR